MELQRAFFVLRNVLAGAPVSGAALVALFGQPPSLGRWAIGAGVAVFGVVVRGWAKSYNAYGRRRGKVLVTTGPYALLRNPLYLGSAFIIGGVAVCSGSLLVGAGGFLWAIGVYEGVTRIEREHLIRRYGDAYRAYAAEVPRWIPASWPRGPLAVPLADVGRAVASESVALGLLLPFLALTPGARAIWFGV